MVGCWTLSDQNRLLFNYEADCLVNVTNAYKSITGMGNGCD